MKIAGTLTPTAIVFGPEDSGLSNDDLRMAQHLLHFPTTAISSINLGQAVTATAASLAAAHRSGVQTDQAPTGSPAPVAARGGRAARGRGSRDRGLPQWTLGRDGREHAGSTRRTGRPTEDEVNNLLGMVKHLGWWSENR